MDEASNTHSLKQQKKPCASFDIPNISFDLRPTKYCSVTHVKGNHDHIGTHRQLGLRKCPKHKSVGLEVECRK